MSALAAPRSLPLRWSAALTALLVLVPAGVLLRWPLLALGMLYYALRDRLG